MQVYDSPADIGLTQMDMCDEDASLEKEGCKFVTFDVEIVTKGIYGLRDDSLADEIAAYENKDGTTGILWIDAYSRIWPRSQETLSGNEQYFGLGVAYFSGHMDGTTNYYHFAANAHDAHEFVVGFYIPDEILSTSEWVIGVLNGGQVSSSEVNTWNGSSEKQTYYSIPAIDLD